MIIFFNAKNLRRLLLKTHNDHIKHLFCHGENRILIIILAVIALSTFPLTLTWDFAMGAIHWSSFSACFTLIAFSDPYV